jgi:small subunit ribosomal protein S2
MVDTNSDPREVDFVIPSNDDASKSIEKILDIVISSISDGLKERKQEKDAITEADLKEMELKSDEEKKIVVDEVEILKEKISKNKL